MPEACKFGIPYYPKFRVGVISIIVEEFVCDTKNVSEEEFGTFMRLNVAKLGHLWIFIFFTG